MGIKKLDVSMYAATGFSTDMEYPPADRSFRYDWNVQQPRGNPSRRNILSYVRYDDINIVLFKRIIKKTDC